MLINYSTYWQKLIGCFTGKSVGGTLGMKLEGTRDVHEVNYYDPVPDQMLPNDDLDLQVVNLETLLRNGLPVSRYHLGQMWQYNLADNAPDEYSVAVSNYKMCLKAPLTGSYRNKFGAGMGAAIRTELWACLAPANPTLAAKFAREDGCTDHYGDGVYAAMFLAAVESAAFIENDIKKLIKIGLDQIPENSKLCTAFKDTLAWYAETADVCKTRELILEKYGVDNFTDVVINLSFILLSLISCENSFDKAICTAVSLGYDTDCTGATVGSIFGILAPEKISSKWTDPIGDSLVLSHCMISMHEVNSIPDFCDVITTVAYEVEKYYKTGISISSADHTLRDVTIAAPWTQNWNEIYNWEENKNVSLIAVHPLTINLVYPDTIAAFPGQKNKYILELTNSASVQLDGNAKLQVPDGWTVYPREISYSLRQGEAVQLPVEITLSASTKRSYLNLLHMEFDINGLRFEENAGLPCSAPLLEENLLTGEKREIEVATPYFTVPEGAYKYTAKVKIPVPKKVKLMVTANRPCSASFNGQPVLEKNNIFYVPAFHRSHSAVILECGDGVQILEITFPAGPAGECFFGFSTLYGGATWDDGIERIDSFN